jgi:hypothetical protein
MHKFLLTLHVLFAVFAVGPLVGAAMAAARGVRAADASAVTSAARTIRLYAYASVLVVIAGMALLRPEWHAEFADLWVWLSVVLWLVAVSLALGLLVPALERAAARLEEEDGAAARTHLPMVAAVGGLIALVFAVIVVLMVYKPGR